jgi:hypothetical protein
MTETSENATSLEPSTALPTPEVIQHVLLGGDLSKLTPAQRVSYYRAVCDSLGLNPLTRPFDYLRLSGREVLYAKKDAAEQLRLKHKVSLGTPRIELLDGTFTVTIAAHLPDGREDCDLGAVDVLNLKGESRANAMMKAITKAKRRVTLSICGLGVLDESELDTMPEATPLDVDPETGEITKPAPRRPYGASARKITQAEQRKLFAVAKPCGWSTDQLRQLLVDRFSVHKSSNLRAAVFDRVLEALERGPGSLAASEADESDQS